MLLSLSSPALKALLSCIVNCFASCLAEGTASSTSVTAEVKASVGVLVVLHADSLRFLFLLAALALQAFLGFSSSGCLAAGALHAPDS